MMKTTPLLPQVKTVGFCLVNLASKFLSSNLIACTIRLNELLDFQLFSEFVLKIDMGLQLLRAAFKKLIILFSHFLWAC